MSYANKGKSNKGQNKANQIQQRGGASKGNNGLQKSQIQFQRVKEMSFQTSWESMGEFIEENIKIVQHQNVKLNSQIDIYDNFLKNQLFVNMEKEPEKLDEYQAQNESKKGELEDAMQNINHDTNVLQQQISSLLEIDVKTPDGASQKKQLQEILESKLSQQKQKLTSNRDKFNRYSQECDQHMANCESDKDNATRYKDLFADSSAKKQITKIDPYKRVQKQDSNDFSYGFNDSNPVQIQQLDDQAKEDLRIKAEAKQRQEQALQKNKDMKNIQNVMEGIQDITMNFNQEIKNQGQQINLIEGNMQDTVQNVEKAKKQLTEANQKQGKDNKKYCAIAVGLFILLMILLYTIVGDPFGGSTNGLKTYRETHPQIFNKVEKEKKVKQVEKKIEKKIEKKTPTTTTTNNSPSTSAASATTTSSSSKSKTPNSTQPVEHALSTNQNLELMEKDDEVAPINYYNGFSILEAILSGFVVVVVALSIEVQTRSGAVDIQKKTEVDDGFERMV